MSEQSAPPFSPAVCALSTSLPLSGFLARRFASCKSGHIFEIDYTRLVIRNVRWLFPVQREQQEKWTLNKGGFGPSLKCTTCTNNMGANRVDVAVVFFFSLSLSPKHKSTVGVSQVATKKAPSTFNDY